MGKERESIIIGEHYEGITKDVNNLEAFKRAAEVIKGAVTDDRVQHPVNGYEFFVCIQCRVNVFHFF